MGFTLAFEMLQRTVMSVFRSTAVTRRLFSSSTISHRQQQRSTGYENVSTLKPRFNRYKTTRFRPKESVNDGENDLFSEEKDDLTMLGTDKKAFSAPSALLEQKSSKTAVSLGKKSET